MQHGNINMLAFAGRGARHQSGGGGLRHRIGRHFVANQHFDEIIAVACFRVSAALHAGQTANALDHMVIGRAVRQWPDCAEAGNRNIDEARIGSAQYIAAQPQLIHHPRPIIIQ